MTGEILVKTEDGWIPLGKIGPPTLMPRPASALYVKVVGELKELRHPETGAREE